MAATTVRRALLYVPASSPRFLQKSTSLTVDNVTYDLEDSVTPSRKADARRDLRLFLRQRHLEQQEKRRREKDVIGDQTIGSATTVSKAEDDRRKGDSEEVRLLDSLRRGGGVRKREGIGEVAVRINSVDSGYALDDLVEVLKAPNIDALVIPKVNSAADLKFVTDVIKHHAPSRLPTTTTTTNTDSHSQSEPEQDPEQPEAKPLLLLALIESAQSLLNLPSITSFSPTTTTTNPPTTSVSSSSTNNNNINPPNSSPPTSTPLLSSLIFAAEDFAHDLSLTRTPSLSEFLYARSAIVTAARAARIPSVIDLVSVAYKTPSSSSSSSSSSSNPPENAPLSLEAEAHQGASLGFTGKQLIHPSQIPPVQSIFGVSPSQAEWAVRVLVGDEKASKEGRGAWTLMPEGMMVDRPVVRRAEGLTQRAMGEGWDLRRVFEGVEREGEGGGR